MLNSGLCDSVNVIMFQENVPDGYGGFKKISNIIKRGYKCRKTMGTTEIYKFLDIMPAGFDRENSWFVTGAYDKDIKEGMYLQFKNDRGELENFEVVKIEEKRDSIGYYHHLHMITEKV